MFLAWFERVELAGKYATANSNLAYAIEAAIKEGQSDKVVSALSTFRNNPPPFDIGTPPDYYRRIESLAQQVNPPKGPDR